MQRLSSESYRINASACFFLGQTPYLQCDLYEGSRYASCEDDAAEGVVEQGFEVSLFWTCS